MAGVKGLQEVEGFLSAYLSKDGTFGPMPKAGLVHTMVLAPVCQTITPTSASMANPIITATIVVVNA